MDLANINPYIRPPLIKQIRDGLQNDQGMDEFTKHIHNICFFMFCVPDAVLRRNHKNIE